MKKFCLFRSLKYGIKNLKNWFHIIWNDREWDYGYLEDILLFKLKNMRDYYRAGTNVWSEGAEVTADEINEVIRLLEEVQKDNYEEKIEPHFNDWIYENRPLSREFTDEDGNVHHMFNSPEWTPEELAHRKEVYREAERQKQADLDKAYGLIAKNIRRWWD